jgi:hypothetical protein
MIFSQLSQQLNSLSKLISLLNDEQYTLCIEHLGNASIGGHTRHIIELLDCAINGYQNGIVDYLNRERNFELQKNRTLAIQTIESSIKNINKSDKILKLVVEEFDTETTVSTTFYREVIYNTEHTIHHLALIKVALFDMNLDLVEPHFGMAYSTIKFNQKLTNAS